MKTLLITVIGFVSLLFAPADTVLTRFRPPEGYHQVAVTSDSFGAYLQGLPLMPPGAHTRTYKGDIAATDVFTAAVVDMGVGHEDLQQLRRCRNAPARRVSVPAKKIRRNSFPF